MATRFRGHDGSQSAHALGRASPARRTHNLAATGSGWARREGSLDILIEAEIIPRLLMAHPGRAQGCADPLAETVTAAEAEHFAALPLTLEADELLAVVEAVLARGVPVESIFIDLLAPSARKLGQFWEEDVCDFVDVTMGLWRLQEVMREVALLSPNVTQPLTAPRSVLFSPMPGEQHSFGTLMVEEIFTRAGWQSEALIEPHRQDLLRLVAERGFDLLGLTITNDCPSGGVADLITALRSVSKNPAIQIFIGGRVVNADPGLAGRVGADGTAPDARAALALAERKVPGSRVLDHAIL